MHIMLIAPEGLPIPPKLGGSVQIYLSKLTKALVKQGEFDVTLVSPQRNRSSLGISSPRFTHVQLAGGQKEYWRGVHRLLRSVQPDVIQVDNRPFAALQLKQAHSNIPLILNLHSTTFLGPLDVKRVQARASLFRVDAVVCNSMNLKKTIRARYQMPISWRPYTIYPGVDEPLVARTDEAPPADRQNPLRILFVGRVIRQKGVHIAIAAVRELMREFPIELTIIGRTPPWEQGYRREILRTARQLPVRFRGFVTPERLAGIYRAHDILLCPSQGHEAFGLVNLEAMSHGLPVVASDTGGIPEAVGEGGILISRYKRASDFADAIRVLRNTETYEEYRQAALHRAKAFTWSATADEFAKLYSSLA